MSTFAQHIISGNYKEAVQIYNETKHKLTYKDLYNLSQTYREENKERTIRPEFYLFKFYQADNDTILIALNRMLEKYLLTDNIFNNIYDFSIDYGRLKKI